MRIYLKEAVIIGFLAVFFALSVNAFRHEGLPLFSRAVTAGGSEENLSARSIGIDEAAEKFAEGVVLFVDARSPREFSHGHIRGAVNLPDRAFDSTFDEVVERLERWDILVAYCEGENCPLGRSVAEKLAQLGFQRVFYLPNGWTLWRERGLPVSEGKGEEG
jgi:rhodanese-related sulfurtransferase